MFDGFLRMYSLRRVNSDKTDFFTDTINPDY